MQWADSFTALAKDFMNRLIVVDTAKRLGSLKSGPAGVKEHPWFAGLDWKQLEAKALPAMHVPKIKSQHDDSNFDEYEDEGLEAYPDANFPKEMFAGFGEWVGK